MVEKLLFSGTRNEVCHFCGGIKRSKRHSCSPRCGKHLESYLEISMPDIFVKRLLIFNDKKAVLAELKTYANRHKFTHASTVRFFCKKAYESFNKTKEDHGIDFVSLYKNEEIN